MEQSKRNKVILDTTTATWQSWQINNTGYQGFLSDRELISGLNICTSQLYSQNYGTVKLKIHDPSLWVIVNYEAWVS